MKKSLFAVAAICLLSSAAAQAQDARFSVIPRPRTTAEKFTYTPAPAGGVVPRAARSGDPLQMINPFAPASFGSGQDTARREETDPYQRAQGIKLLSVDF